MLVGWGGRSFYMETPTFADIKPGPTFRALTIDSSVMHVDMVGDIPLSLPVVTALDISDAAYANLLAAMSASFTRKDGHVLPIEGYALSENDRFFEGEGIFNALLGCNLWTARMLQSAGLRTGFWTPLPVLLTTSLGWTHAAACTSPSVGSPSPLWGGRDQGWGWSQAPGCGPTPTQLRYPPHKEGGRSRSRYLTIS